MKDKTRIREEEGGIESEERRRETGEEMIDLDKCLSHMHIHCDLR